MKLTSLCAGAKEFVHILLLNLGDSLIKQKSMACVSSSSVGVWHKKGQDSHCEGVYYCSSEC